VRRGRDRHFVSLLGEVSAAQSQKIEEFLTTLAGEWAVKVPPATDEVSRRLRKEVWSAWWKATDGPLLLEEFKKRSLPDAERESPDCHRATRRRRGREREAALSALQQRAALCCRW
jgi:hypothetical protein